MVVLKKYFRDEERRRRREEQEAELSAQARVRAEVAELSLGDRDELVSAIFLQLMEGVSWWDLLGNTGLPEDTCRRAVALRDEIAEQQRRQRELRSPSALTSAVL